MEPEGIKMILDTSVLVRLLRGDEKIKKKIKECEENMNH